MDYEWFYDSNLHMNSAGMYVYTRQIVEVLKAQLSIDTETKIDIPEKPEIPADDAEEGDNADAACFTYELVQDDQLVMAAGTYNHPDRGTPFDERSLSDPKEGN